MATKRALLSVYDKTGLAELGQGLAALGWELVSTGGTAKALGTAGISVRELEDYTGFPEMMDGRVKTLHPRVFGGILGRRDDPKHMEQARAHGIQTIDLVVSNLYPFRQTVDRHDVTLAMAIENIDIGGPSMIRAAAKNYPDVLVIVEPADYARVLAALRAAGGDPRGVGPDLRYELAWRAFAHTAAYDAAVSTWLGQRISHTPADMPDKLVLYFERAQQLSYGENPHQAAALYREPFYSVGLLGGMQQVLGKPLSFNNLNDAQGAVSAVAEFARPAAVAVKHATPCGVGVADTLADAIARAHEADPVSIYGGILAVNQVFDAAAAAAVRRIHLDVLVAPDYTEEALPLLAKKASLRALRTGAAMTRGYQALGGYDLKRIGGGLLLQAPDYASADPATWEVVTQRQPTAAEMTDLEFAWAVVKHVKSNAIVLAAGGMTVGIGGGQTNRVESARIAARAAGERARGAVMASDAFVPFADTVEVAAAAGVTAIVQPGGSIRDAEAIAAADAAGMAMMFTRVRHLRH
jgi:phosphoribosylaminoimidazolecarboxamide formyltransferase/IMP cyclohydrolase